MKQAARYTGDQLSLFCRSAERTLEACRHFLLPASPTDPNGDVGQLSNRQRLLRDLQVAPGATEVARAVQ